MFECPRCLYSCKLKTDIKRHLSRKNECDPVLSNIDRNKCILMIDSKEHISGDFVKDKIREQYKTIQEQTNELEKLKKENEKLRNYKGPISGSGNLIGDNNTNCNNTNIHIHVNSFEKTDYTVLKDKIHTCIKNGKVDEAKLIKLLHFNKDAPQNHNIKIENKRENRIKVYNGIKFEESEYNGKEGIFKFSQDTLKKTGDQEFVENDDKAFDAIEKTKDENYTLNRNEKAQNVGKISTVLYNGID
jgi:hypothetical protein